MLDSTSGLSIWRPSHSRQLSAGRRRHPWLGQAAIVALMLLIFTLDTTVSWEVGVSALYSIVILLSVFSYGRRGVFALSAGCAFLTLVSYLVTPHGSPVEAALNVLIGVTI